MKQRVLNQRAYTIEKGPTPQKRTLHHRKEYYTEEESAFNLSKRDLSCRKGPYTIGKDCMKGLYTSENKIRFMVKNDRAQLKTQVSARLTIKKRDPILL